MMEKCGCCNGMGQVYISRPTTGPSGIEECSNCSGNGVVFIAGIFCIGFKRYNELPKVVYKTRTDI